MSDFEKDKLELDDLQKQLKFATENFQTAIINYNEASDLKNQISSKIKELYKRIYPNKKYFEYGEHVHIKPAAFTNLPEFDGIVVEAIEHLDCYRIFSEQYLIVEVPRDLIFHIKTETTTKYY